MSIVHIGIDGSTWNNDRGYGRFTRCLITALAARNSGFRYSLLMDEAASHPLPDNVEVIYAGSQDLADGTSGAKTRSGNYMTQMGSAAKAMGADLFFFPTVSAYYPVFSSVPKVIGFLDTIPERFPDLIFPSAKNRYLWKAKAKLAKFQATRVMTISEASALDLGKFHGISRDKIDIVSLAADDTFQRIEDTAVLEAARVESGIPDGARLLVYIGGFNRHKNVIRLIEAMPRILAAHPDTYLAIVGRITGARFWDNIEELQASAANDAKASDRIGFTGGISDETMAALLNTAEALVFPSLWEGFGLPAVEAMACGAPVLASNCSSLPEVVGDGGLLFDPTRADDIADTTIRLLGDGDLAQDLRQKAVRQAAGFTWDRGAEMAEACFRATLKA